MKNIFRSKNKPALNSDNGKIKDLLKKIESTLSVYLKEQGLGKEQSTAVTAACVNYLKPLIDMVTLETAINALQQMNGSLVWLDRKIVYDVNPRKEIPGDFLEKYQLQWNKFGDKKSVHLELGTYTTWPEEKVNEYIKDQNIGDFIRLDFNAEFGPDIAANVCALPFADSSIDRVSSNSLFEHVAYPHDIIREAYRVLRPGGILYTAVPFHFVQHGCPNDYLRYTGAFFTEFCKDAGFAEVYCDTQSTSGLYYVLHQFSKGTNVNAEAVDEFSVLSRSVHLSMMSLLSILQALDKYFDGGATSHYHTTIALAVKPGEYQPRNNRVDRSLSFVERYGDMLICPITGSKLTRVGDRLVTEDGKYSYYIVNGIPNMVVKNGQWSRKFVQ